MKLLCRLFGHKPIPNFTDGGFHVCIRCNMHEYWHSQFTEPKGYFWNDSAILLKPYWRLSQFIRHKKITFYAKVYRLKKRFGSIPEDDLPF